MSDWYSMNVVLIQTTLTTVLLALSIQVPMRYGVFSFAGVGAFGIGGYTGAMAMVHGEWTTWPAVLLGTVVLGSVFVVRAALRVTQARIDDADAAVAAEESAPL